jgi:hypothetical protein
VIFRLAADLALLTHLAFILFVLLGAMLAARWPWIAFVHPPAAAWGFFVEVTGRVCPLTYLENFLRAKAGESAYVDGFLDHYLVAIIYPAGLTRDVRYALAALVVGVNVGVYSWLFHGRQLSPREHR